jgi:hypothetical protein
MKGAGFRGVEILQESVFPLDCIANEQTAKPIIEGVKFSGKVLEKISNSILSIKVRGVKPSRTGVSHVG